MSRYRVCDLSLESNIPLPELPTANGLAAECTFELLSQPGPLAGRQRWFHHWHLEDGEPWLSFARRGSGYLLRFRELADFEVADDGRRLTCYPVAGTPRASIRHLLLNQVVPLALSQRGRLVLHASGVVAQDTGLAFLGAAGRGKSTLTASFVRAGFPLLTDDCLLLRDDDGRLVGVPSYPGLRLWPDVAAELFGPEAPSTRVAHYSRKRRLSLANGPLPFRTAPVGLGRAYVLAPPEAAEDGTIGLTRLSPRDACIELLQYAFRLDLADRGHLADQFASLIRVASSLQVRRLTFPRDLARLPAVRAAILADLAEEPVER